MYSYTDYSSSVKAFESLIPATGASQYASLLGQFRVQRLPQANICEVIQKDPVEEGHLNDPYDVSLAETLKKIQAAVGKVNDETGQLGTCSLLSFNLAIVPYHCIAGQELKNLTVVFQNVIYNRRECRGEPFPIQGVVECDVELDYAIMQLGGDPGRKYGWLPLCQDSGICSEPLLLHHPLGKPLKVSVHHMENDTKTTPIFGRLLTYHDTDYGSSGGAYVNPRGHFFAMHLGTEREMTGFNLLRIAISIETMIQHHPRGLLSAFARKELPQDATIQTRQCVERLTPYDYPYITLEKFIHANLSNGNYILRKPTRDLPGVMIEHYQAKHTPQWPKPYPGKKGSSFNGFYLDEIIELAEAIMASRPLFREFHAKNVAGNLIRINSADILVSKELSKKLKNVRTVNLYAAFDFQTKYWSIHFYPEK